VAANGAQHLRRQALLIFGQQPHEGRHAADAASAVCGAVRNQRALPVVALRALSSA
jgi:hypothetical protein